MKTVTIAEATNDLPRLLAEVELGEEITIARDGNPVACLHRLGEPAATAPRRLGLLEGQGWISPDFNEPMPEAELASWEDAPLTSQR